VKRRAPHLLSLALVAVAVSRVASASGEESPGAVRPAPPDTEFALVPFAGGSSDQGFGGGFIASLARVDAEHEPYAWRVESADVLSESRDEAGAWSLPYNDDYLLVRLPHVVDDRLGVELRLSYTREATLKYYGLGNASRIPARADPAAATFEHLRVHPTARMTWSYRSKPFVLSLGAAYTQNSFEVPANGKLALDMQSADPRVRELLGGTEPHGTPELLLGVGWDTRDDEVSPTRGLYVTEEVSVTPDTFGAGSYRFARLGTALRAYVPIAPRERRLVLALRVVSDLLVGNPPFYVLPRFGHTSAIGGGRGVRGVPAQRYYGKIKAFSNVELRSELFSLRILGEDRRFGLAAFCDFGRVWTDYRAHPELDGTGWGLKYGLGGGLRIASGESFVLRADVGWSPDAHPVSAYLVSGHAF
jgi:outer membrane protein assembly factor BamA